MDELLKNWRIEMQDNKAVIQHKGSGGSVVCEEYGRSIAENLLWMLAKDITDQK